MNKIQNMCLGLVFAAGVFLLSSETQADNWGHWRGPSGNGAAENATPPTEWGPDKNVKWKVAVPGKGSGSPVVWGDKIFVVTGVSESGNAGQGQGNNARPGGQQRGGAQRRGGQQGGQRGGPGGQRGGQRGGRRGGGGAPLTKTTFKLICFDLKSGNKVWEQTSTEATPHQRAHQTNNFASASPCTDGEHVYAFFGSRGLFCYTMDGELKWKKTDFGKMETRNAFGEGASPTIAGDMIIVPWDHEGPSSLFALNKSTGEVAWQTKRDEPTNWSTPLVVDRDGHKQVVMNGQTCARGYDLASGKELWKCGGQTERPCASAVSSGDLVFVGSGFRGSFLGAFKLDGKGDLANSSSVAWSINQDTPDVASPLLSGDRLYFHKAKTGIISCLNSKTGKPYFAATRVQAIQSTYASPVAAGGYVFITGRSGKTVVIKDAGKFEIVSTNSVGEAVDATPAPVGNELIIRGEKHLFCIAQK